MPFHLRHPAADQQALVKDLGMYALMQRAAVVYGDKVPVMTEGRILVPLFSTALKPSELSSPAL